MLRNVMLDIRKRRDAADIAGHRAARTVIGGASNRQRKTVVPVKIRLIERGIELAEIETELEPVRTFERAVDHRGPASRIGVVASLEACPGDGIIDRRGGRRMAVSSEQSHSLVDAVVEPRSGRVQM